MTSNKRTNKACELYLLYSLIVRQMNPILFFPFFGLLTQEWICIMSLRKSAIRGKYEGMMNKFPINKASLREVSSKNKLFKS
jgi:hypothetical protein